MNCLLLTAFFLAQEFYDENTILQRKLEGAVKKNVSPMDIEAFVTQRALINTSREDDLRTFLLAKIRFEQSRTFKRQDIFEFNAVVYWNATVTPSRPRIVGVVWTKGGKMKIFRGGYSLAD
jgi:hypothetical protein